MKQFIFNVTPTNPELNNITLDTIKSKTKYLLSHFEKIESLFQEQHTRLIQECNNQNKQVENNDSIQYDYRASDELLEIEFIYLRMHSYSATLASYAYLENSMTKICTNYKENMNLPLTVSDLTGDGIVRCRKYLEFLAKINFEDIEPQWQSLLTLNKLRNCIIHADGNADMTRSPNALVSIINNTNGLSFIEKHLINISPNYIRTSINNIESTLLHLIKKI